MKKILILSCGLILCLSCASKNVLKLPNDEMIDAVARNLKNELLKNYQSSSKKVIAITSFTRTELIEKNKKYSRSIPKLGILLANSLQNEMFEPKKYDLIERTRLDSIFDEYVYSLEMPVEKMITLKLKDVDYILLGTLQKREKSIRIDARLVSVESGKVASIGTTTIPLTEYTQKMYDDCPEQVQETEYTIYAYKDWQMVPFEIKAPAEVEISASGSWGMTSDTKEFGPEGSRNNPSGWGDYRIDTNFNHGQLLIRKTIDKESNLSMGTYIFTEDCFLECIINDDERANNVGAQIIKIKVKSIAK